MVDPQVPESGVGVATEIGWIAAEEVLVRGVQTPVGAEFDDALGHEVALPDDHGHGHPGDDRGHDAAHGCFLVPSGDGDRHGRVAFQVLQRSPLTGDR